MKKEEVSIICGVASLLCLVAQMPIVALVTGIAGIVYGTKAGKEPENEFEIEYRKETEGGADKAAKIKKIIGLALSILGVTGAVLMMAFLGFALWLMWEFLMALCGA